MERRQFGVPNNWVPPNTYSTNQNNQQPPQYFHQYPVKQIIPPNYSSNNNYGINQMMYKSNIQNYDNNSSQNSNLRNMVKYTTNNNFQNIENQNNIFQSNQNSYIQPRVKNQLYSSQIFGIQSAQTRVPKQIAKINLNSNLQSKQMLVKKQSVKTNENKKRQQLEAIRKQLEEVSKKLSVHNFEKNNTEPTSQIPKKNYGIAQSMINTTNQQQSYNFYSNIEPKKKAFGSNNAQANKFLQCLSSKPLQAQIERSKILPKAINEIEAQKIFLKTAQSFSNLNLTKQENQRISIAPVAGLNSLLNLNNPKNSQQPLSQVPTIAKTEQNTFYNAKKQESATVEASKQQSKNTKMFKKKQNPLIQTFSYVDIGQNSKKSTSSNSTNPIKFQKSDFMIGKRMGKGQFGEVFLVRHKLTGFICGMKIMEKKQIKSERYAAQISRELSIQFYLAHRNIAPLYGYFEDQNFVYLLLEFCPDGQLYDKMKKQRRLSEEQTSQIIRQACQGIDYIHKQLIIHRDIKPQNILFSFGQIKICDFGWAVYRGQGLRKTASGSPLYYSPQIVLGNEYDEKIDIWDIGMMTYECILGKVPFRIYSQLDLNRIVTDDIKFPEYVDVTDEAKDFILKTMRKDPQERMQIREMLKHPFLVKHKPQKPPIEIVEDFTKVLN